MLVTSDSSKLVLASPGDSVVFCTRPAKVHAKAWGKVLIEYTKPELKQQPFWSWSRGGGGAPSRLEVTDLASALAWFEKEVRWTRDFWAKRLPSCGCLVVSHEAYSDSGWDKKSNPSFLGFSGAKWGIENLKTGYKWSTNNLWHFGWVPDEAWIGDTHKFIPYAHDLPTTPEHKCPVTVLPLSVEQARIVEH